MTADPITYGPHSPNGTMKCESCKLALAVDARHGRCATALGDGWGGFCNADCRDAAIDSRMLVNKEHVTIAESAELFRVPAWRVVELVYAAYVFPVDYAQPLFKPCIPTLPVSFEFPIECLGANLSKSEDFTTLMKWARGQWRAMLRAEDKAYWTCRHARGRASNLYEVVRAIDKALGCGAPSALASPP